MKFYRDEPRTLTITALLRPDGDDLVAECRLAAERDAARRRTAAADGALHRLGAADAPNRRSLTTTATPRPVTAPRH